MKKRTIFAIIGGVVALVAAIVGGVFYATSGMTGAADKFFQTARGGDIQAVYALTSAELRNTTSPERLAGFIEANRFDEVAETSWSSRTIENNLGSVEGTVTLDDGGIVPITMQLVKQADGWMVSLIELRQAGVQGGAAPQPGRQDASGSIPPDNVVLNLVRFHTGVFFDAARRNDVEYFRQSWADGITLAQLEELTASLEGADEAMELLDRARPVVERTIPAEGGGFEAIGYIPAEPWRFQYAYRFRPVGESWKVTDFRYELMERD